MMQAAIREREEHRRQQAGNGQRRRSRRSNIPTMASVMNQDGLRVLPSKRKAETELPAVTSDELPSKEEIKRAVKDYVKTHLLPPAVYDHSQLSPYPPVQGIPNAYNTFNLHQGGLPKAKRERAIACAKRYHAEQKSRFFGYQCNQALDYAEEFGGYMDTHVNNIGDSFAEGNFTVNSKFMERAVLDYYAALWHARWPHDSKVPDSYWGFCLTMGSTEGNLYGMWNARDYLGGKKILWSDTKKSVRRRDGTGAAVTTQITVPRLMYHEAPKENTNAYTPIAFYSEDTHYSLAKAMTMLDIRTFYAEGQDKFKGQCPLEGDEWPAEVPSLESGAMDMDALAVLVEFFASKGYPIMVCFNYGTTFKGAYDDVAAACTKLKPILKKYNLLEREVHYDEEDPSRFDVRTGYWFHVDGALGAAYMPFIEMAYHGGLVEERGPCFDFRLPMVHSIAMSGHKWIGVPVPCGVYMTRTKYQMLPPDIPEYIGTPDTTFAGSRNGLSPMLLWDYIAGKSFEDQISKALRLQALTKHTESRLRYLQDEVLKTDLYVERTPLALTVRFKRANDALCHKYSLSNETLDGRFYSHVFVMDHVTHDLIEALIEDLSQDGAFYEVSYEKSIISAERAAVDSQVLAPATHRLALVPSQGRGFHG